MGQDIKVHFYKTKSSLFFCDTLCWTSELPGFDNLVAEGSLLKRSPSYKPRYVAIIVVTRGEIRSWISLAVGKSACGPR